MLVICRKNQAMITCCLSVETRAFNFIFMRRRHDYEQYSSKQIPTLPKCKTPQYVKKHIYPETQIRNPLCRSGTLIRSSPQSTVSMPPQSIYTSPSFMVIRWAISKADYGTDRQTDRQNDIQNYRQMPLKTILAAAAKLAARITIILYDTL